MAEGLRSRSALEITISDKIDKLYAKVLQLEEHILKSLLESKQARQIQLTYL